MRTTTILPAVLIVSLLGGCSARMSQEQLEDVAQDWCLTIRASQVIPVYPLSEDLQPGDVFLVTQPVDRQHEEYDEKGFLGFDNHLARLNPARYDKFYAESFEAGGADAPLPRTWLSADADDEAWQDAPDAAFPSYGFSIRRGSELNLALPIHGVPVGLGLLGADSAEATISIADAKTYGIDTISIDQQLRRWARDHRAFLSNFAPTEDAEGIKQYRYVRVITRIYLTKRIDVSLRNAKLVSAGLDAGKPRPVQLPTLSTPADPEASSTSTAEDYRAGLEGLNQSLGESLNQLDADGNLLPGASLRVTAASSGSVSLQDTFNRPLVIGYLGLDAAILEDGGLGPPIPTHSILEKEVGTQTFTAFHAGSTAARSWKRGALISMYIAAEQDGETELIARLDRAHDVLPQAYPVRILDPALGGEIEGGVFQIAAKKAAGDAVTVDRNFQGAMVYLNQLDQTLERLNEAILATSTDTNPLQVQDAAGQTYSLAQLQDERADVSAKIDRYLADLDELGIVQDLIDYFRR